MKRLLAAAILAATVAGCGGATHAVHTAATKATHSPKSTPSPSPSYYTNQPYIVVPPMPRVSYSQSCDYLLGNFTNNTARGYRLIAQATIRNTGNVGVVARVTATWYPVGLRSIVKSKTERLPKGRTARADFLVPTTRDTIEAYQASSDPSACKVHVALVRTFGSAS